MFDKITVGVVLLLIAFGAFWFFYYEGGANRPITIEGTVTVKVAGQATFDSAGKVGVYATPKKLAIDLSEGDMDLDLILRLDKKLVYIVNHAKRSYAEMEFKYVDKGKIESAKESKFKWEDLFETKVDGKYIGEDPEKYYCRKLVMKNFPGKYEMWLSRDLRIGRSYVNGLNKVLRIDPVNMPDIPAGGGGNRPQIRYRNMEYFPLPLKMDLAMVQGPQRISFKWEATRVSRKSINNSEFEVPSGFSKIGLQDMQQQIMQMQAMKQPGRPAGALRGRR